MRYHFSRWKWGGSVIERLAHLVLDGEELREQSVYQHCSNVANYVIKSTNTLPIQSTVYLSALLHDVGKANDDFSNYLKKAVLYQKKDKKVNHSSAGAMFLLKNIHGENDKLSDLVKTIICEIIISHHGLNDFIAPNGDNRFENRCFPDKDIQFEQVEEYVTSTFDIKELQQLFVNAEKEIQNLKNDILENAKKEADKKTVYYFYFSSLIRYLLSIVINADREDARAFGLNIPMPVYNDTSALWTNAINRLEDHLKTFQTKKILDCMRKKISEECKEAANKVPGIYKLSCPTGSGKTLASLRFALYHAKKYNKKHLIYIAPYKTILEQNAEVIEQFFSSDDVLEHHSNIIPEDAEDYSYLNSNWSTPVILTTAVQFYQTLFSDNTTSIRRFHQLSDSVIIIDEAQTLPIHMIHMFNTMMNFITEMCKSTILLCTATQPTFDVVRLPLHYAENAEIVKNVTVIQEAFKRVHVKNACNTRGFNEYEYHKFIMSCWKKHNKVLVIVNTKTEAAILYKKCLEDDLISQNNVELYHLTTNMCPQHRQEKLKLLKNVLNHPNDSVICIATNLIECGVDISFDCVIRSLTCLDSIIQAAGRCNRNKSIDYGLLYLVKSGFEHIDKMPVVKNGKAIVQLILQDLEVNDRGYIDQLFSEDYIAKYYQKLYFDEKDKMDYPIKDLQATQMELWTLKNESIAETMKTKHNFMPSLFSALKTAGENFEVIDRTIGILAPYGKGEEIIKTLNSGAEDAVKYSCLKEAQKFTIQAYERTVQQLIDKRIVSMIEFGRVLYLNKEYYDDAIGLNIASEMDVLTV